MATSPNSEREHLFFKYRGFITGILGEKEKLVFTTRHSEGQATALVRINLDSASMSSEPLNTGINALVRDQNDIFAAGTDGIIYKGEFFRGGLVPLTPPAGAGDALAVLKGNRLAALSERSLRIYSTQDGVILQELSLPENGTVLAADDSGDWLAAGTGTGRLVIFNCEDTEEFKESSSEQIHDGAVSALLFERGELRILSAGSDLRLSLTHVRGKLEPEDRGGKSNHEQLITDLIHAPGNRFYSASKDKAVKNWAAGYTQKKPATFQGSGSPIRRLTLNEIGGKPHITLACDDSGFLFYQLDENGKIGKRTLAIYDAYSRARSEFKRPEAGFREAALRELAGYLDNKSLEMIGARATKDEDHGLRILAANLLGESKNPRAVRHLEKLFSFQEEGVQLAAFEGLRKQVGERSLRPMQLALINETKQSKGTLGKAAVHALEKLADQDDQALTCILEILNAEPRSLRLEALFGLERLFPPESPRAQLMALKSKFADVRLEALLRIYQKGFLEKTEITHALRKQGEDSDPAVRKRAFYISLLSRPNLAKVLRGLDQNIHRHLYELEHRDIKPEEAGELPPAEKISPKTLSPSDYRPLLEAMTGRALDTSLLGATALAHLRDARALGALLQLSREKEESIRITVCIALKQLNDARALGRLNMMLHDTSARVRDAAFSALFSLDGTNPRSAIEAAFNTGDENVRHRGLQLLLELIKAEADAETPRELNSFLERALNDASLKISRETFKAILTPSLSGAIDEKLKFCLRSIHSGIRNDVLTEIRAHAGETWAFGLLLGFFQDPDEELRKAAFEFASERYRKDIFKILTRALESNYLDIRRLATQKLRDNPMLERPLAESRDLIRRCLQDKKLQIRRLMTDALIELNAEEELIKALDSEFSDVRLTAAGARAEYGDNRALAPLLAIINAREPEDNEKAKKLWKENLLQGLAGLRSLANPEAFESIAALTGHESEEINIAAARALTLLCDPGRRENLRSLLAHPKDAVKKEIALALAYLGDSTGASLLFQKANEESLLAALTLGKEKEDYLLSLLDNPDESLRDRAFLLCLLLENSEKNPAPARLLAGLSSSYPRVRLESAGALRSYSEPKKFGAFTGEKINYRGERSQPWTISNEIVNTLGAILSRGEPRIRVFAFQNILTGLFNLKKREKGGRQAFERLWENFSRRFSAGISEIIKNTPPGARGSDMTYSRENLLELAFGAYAGLSRLPGGGDEVRIRLKAMGQIREMALANPELKEQARAVLPPAFHDPNETVRKQAFDYLIELGADPGEVASEALESGRLDLGQAGLNLLARDKNSPETVRICKHVLKTYTDGTEEDAARLLRDVEGRIPTCIAGLEVRSPNLRKKSVSDLAALLADDSDADEQSKKTARDALRKALESRYQDVVRASAQRLVQLKDLAALPTLEKMLFTDNEKEQKEVIKALVRLDAPEAPDILINRMERDPAGTARKDQIFEALGSFRNPSTVERLTTYLSKKKTRQAAYLAILKISGYDQEIENEERHDWEKDKYPRRDEILAGLLENIYKQGDESLLFTLIEIARVAREGLVDSRLKSLVRYPRDRIRNEAVFALGRRLKYRGAPLEAQEGLHEALGHRDGQTRFLAAEGLALMGGKDGLNILLTATELLSDYDDRIRAVRALGHLADERALDTLLRFAADPEHALREHAVEAIGHMKNSAKSAEIFETLSRLARPYSGMQTSALTGLRWFNTRSAWEIIRKNVESSHREVREKVAELLEFDPDPAGRKILEILIKTEDDEDLVETAAESLRKIYGENELEAVYVFLQSPCFHSIPDAHKDFLRLGREGDPGRLLSILPGIFEDEYRTDTITMLLNRDPLPVPEAIETLENAQDYGTIEAAAHIIGRATPESLSEEQRKLPGKKLKEFWNVWQKTPELDSEDDSKYSDEYVKQAKKLKALSQTCQKLIWACGRVGAGGQTLRLVLEDDSRKNRFLRQEALLALSRGAGDALELPPVEKLLTASDPYIRRAAAACLNKLAPARAEDLLARLADDGPGFHQLVENNRSDKTLEFLQTAARGIHTQGIALPHLIKRQDTAGIQNALGDTSLPEVTRLGLIESLGAIQSEEGEEGIESEIYEKSRTALIEFATSESENEELRKAAWRAIRRAGRARQKARTMAENKEARA